MRLGKVQNQYVCGGRFLRAMSSGRKQVGHEPEAVVMFLSHCVRTLDEERELRGFFLNMWHIATHSEEQRFTLVSIQF